MSANGWFCLSTIKKKKDIKIILLHKRKSQRKKAQRPPESEYKKLEAEMDVMEDLGTGLC